MAVGAGWRGGEDDHAEGNRVTVMRVRLPMDIDDPIERLRAIHAVTRSGKKGRGGGGAVVVGEMGGGREAEPKCARARATGRFGTLARERGVAPYMRVRAAFSGGVRLYAGRYASDDHAPSLYHRWSDTRRGRAVVSEPLEVGECDWHEVPPGSFCTFEGKRVSIEPFEPLRMPLAS